MPPKNVRKSMSVQSESSKNNKTINIDRNMVEKHLKTMQIFPNIMNYESYVKRFETVFREKGGHISKTKVALAKEKKFKKVTDNTTSCAAVLRATHADAASELLAKEITNMGSLDEVKKCISHVMTLARKSESVAAVKGMIPNLLKALSTLSPIDSESIVSTTILILMVLRQCFIKMKCDYQDIRVWYVNTVRDFPVRHPFGRLKTFLSDPKSLISYVQDYQNRSSNSTNSSSESDNGTVPMEIDGEGGDPDEIDDLVSVMLSEATSGPSIINQSCSSVAPTEVLVPADTASTSESSINSSSSKSQIEEYAKYEPFFAQTCAGLLISAKNDSTCAVAESSLQMLQQGTFPDYATTMNLLPMDKVLKSLYTTTKVKLNLVTEWEKACPTEITRDLLKVVRARAAAVQECETTWGFREIQNLNRKNVFEKLLKEEVRESRVQLQNQWLQWVQKDSFRTESSNLSLPKKEFMKDVSKDYCAVLTFIQTAYGALGSKDSDSTDGLKNLQSDYDEFVAAEGVNSLKDEDLRKFLPQMIVRFCRMYDKDVIDEIQSKKIKTAEWVDEKVDECVAFNVFSHVSEVVAYLEGLSSGPEEEGESEKVNGDKEFEEAMKQAGLE